MSTAACEHGYAPGECPENGCLYRREVKDAILGLAGLTTAVADQAQAMTDAELGTMLLSGRWSTIEVHEAGRRLVERFAALEEAERVIRVTSGWNPDRVSVLEAIEPAARYLREKADRGR